MFDFKAHTQPQRNMFWSLPALLPGICFLKQLREDGNSLLPCLRSDFEAHTQGVAVWAGATPDGEVKAKGVDRQNLQGTQKWRARF